MGLNLLRLFQPTNSEKPLGGRYKILSQLGAGGFGQTFLAEDLHLPDRPQCVVKQLKPQTHDAAFLQTARRLFDTEARVLYQLGDHEQIPRLLAHFEENEEFYLAQELIVGNPLTKELVNSKPWSESQTIALLQDVLQVLAFVHHQNVIHRDIKPSNLMRCSYDGKIVLIDFGAVKQVTTQLLNPSSGKTDLTISIGTQGYVPKEQLGGQPRFSSDVYAVGIIGIQALTGLHPKLLREDSETGEIKWRDFAPQVSPELAEFLDLMVRYDFRTRYQTAAEALEALQGLPEAIAPSLPASAQTPDSTASGTDDLSTQFWEPTPPPVQPQPAASNTAPPTTERHYPHSSGSSSPTLAAPEPTQRRFLKPLLAIAILAAVGGGSLLARTFFFSQFVSQTPIDRTSTEQTAVNSPELAKLPATDRSNLEKTDKEFEPTPSESPVAESTPQDTNPSTPVATQSPEQPAATQTPSASKKPSGTQAPPTSNKPAPPQASPAPSPAKPAPPAPEPQVDAAAAETQWQRCYTLNTQQRFAEAITACDRALAINPNYPEALWSKGAALQQQGKHQEALTLYERATTLKPDFADAWINQGVALILLGNPDKAITALDKATTLNPNSVDAWVNKAEALMELERFDDAVVSLKKALAIQPNHEYALSMLLAAQTKR